jgi:hypothetical protein
MCNGSRDEKSHATRSYSSEGIGGKVKLYDAKKQAPSPR